MVDLGGVGGSECTPLLQHIYAYEDHSTNTRAMFLTKIKQLTKTHKFNDNDTDNPPSTTKYANATHATPRHSSSACAGKRLAFVRPYT